MSIPISPYNISLEATSIQVAIDDFQFGSRLVIKISFFDVDNNFLLNYYVKIEGDDYTALTTSSNSDIFIKQFVENKLGISILI